MNNEKIVFDSKEKVAYDLATTISSHENKNEKDRAYWLTLYRQCYKATSGSLLKDILKED